MAGPVPELAERARACAELLCEAEEVLLASHIDADGLTSAAVASTALARAAIPHEVVFFDQLDAAELERVAATDYKTVLFTDFGSGQIDLIREHERAGSFRAVIADHHQPATDGAATDESADETDETGDNESPALEIDTEYHLNPLLFGIDGASELSGAGASYLLARALADESGNPGQDESDLHHDAANRDLAALAVVGAVGDMQASGGELVGANRAIVEEGVDAGVLEEGTDLAIYGKQTRPLPKLLEYAGDVPIPGVTGDENGALRFLDGLDLDFRADEDTDRTWRRWVDLTDEEKQTVASALVRRAVSRGVPAEKVNSLVGTTYVLADEEPGTELRDASEFSTLLNATARYERADVGLAVCLGDRDGALDQARKLLTNHRRNLSEGISLVEQEGVERAEHVQWFHAGDRIRETIVGIVAGMSLGSDGVSRDRPILAFADADEDEVKVSARAPPGLVRRGLDLSAVMSEASTAVEGEGGGHDIAAGATIPAGNEEVFVDRADEIVGEQLGG